MKKMLLTVAIFVAVSHPMVSNTVQSVTGAVLPEGTQLSSGNCATTLGSVVLAVLFALVTYLVFKKQDNKMTEQQHRKNAVHSGLLFFLVSNRNTYELTQRLVGGFVQTFDGMCPTTMGTVAHGFALIGLRELLKKVAN